MKNISSTVFWEGQDQVLSTAYLSIDSLQHLVLLIHPENYVSSVKEEGHASYSLPVALARPFSRAAAPPSASRLESISIPGLSVAAREGPLMDFRKKTNRSPFHHPLNQPRIDISLAPQD